MKALILGGAGFVGSHIAEALIAAGSDVTIVDGLIPGTGGRAENVASLPRDRVRCQTIEDTEEVSHMADGAVVVDAMGWTQHAAAIADPERDLRLNLASHLALLKRLGGAQPSLLVYLGSTHEYGRVDGVIDEETPLVPVDVQGIHKAAADHHFRIFASLARIPVVSVRFGNTFGERQPWLGDDIGLIGSLARDLLQRGVTRVYDGPRSRNCVYVLDIAETIVRLASTAFDPGYRAFNLSGHELTVVELAEALVGAIGSGTYTVGPIPEVRAKADTGTQRIDGERLDRAIGGTPRTELRLALARTVSYLRERMRSAPTQM